MPKLSIEEVCIKQIKMKIYSFFSVLIFTAGMLFSAGLEINEKFQAYVGGEEFFFHSISFVTGDEEKNIMVLDQKACRVFIFSKKGELLRSFGNCGHGPGDINDAHSISSLSNGNIVVNEIRDIISIFNGNGKFKKKIRVSNSGLNLNYLNDNLFYCWKWSKKKKDQVLIDIQGTIKKAFFSIQRSDFSINITDKKGHLVMFNYFSEVYTPYFIFKRYKNYAICGVSNRYELHLVDNFGNTISKILRTIQPDRLSKHELDFLKEQIKNHNKFPGFVKKKFIKKLPTYKNYFSNIFVTDNKIWVFRVREDVTSNISKILVELFNFKSNYMGSFYMKRIPIYISSDNIYYVKSNEDDDLLLEQYYYNIRKLENNGAR